MYAFNLIALVVIIFLVVIGLRKLNEVLMNFYDESVEVCCPSKQVLTRPPEQHFLVGDLVYSYELDSEGVIVETDSVESSICTDSFGNEVFKNIDNSKLRIVKDSWLCCLK